MEFKKIIDEVRSLVQPTEYLDYRDYLDAVYQCLKEKLSKYSYVQFAEDLGFSKTNVVHLIIKGKRPLSVKGAGKIIAALGLTNVSRIYFEKLVKYKNSRKPAERESLFQELVQIKSKSVDSQEAKDQLEFFSEWYHSIIYQMSFSDVFYSDPSWISDHITPRIRPEQARKSLQLLEILGLIKFDENEGRHFPTKRRVSTTDEIASVAIVRYHQKMIETGKESITAVDEDLRDISSITTSISPELLPKIKQEISHFRKKILMLEEQSKKDPLVYQMNIQLFPVTKRDKKNKKGVA